MAAGLVYTGPDVRKALMPYDQAAPTVTWSWVGHDVVAWVLFGLVAACLVLLLVIRPRR